jgi:ubiquinone/menaquinone biosynthesis C-methylase UbiE
MDKTMSAFEFNIMRAAFSVRDILISPAKVLDETRLNPGDTVLDYGCGSGSYSFAAAEKVGEKGKVYALDILPLAVKKMDTTIHKKNISNIETICSACHTGLESNCIDAVLFFDTFHMCNNREAIVSEFYRVLKKNGVLYVNDHHLKEEKIISEITKSGLFSLLRKGRKMYSFVRNK